MDFKYESNSYKFFNINILLREKRRSWVFKIYKTNLNNLIKFIIYLINRTFSYVISNNENEKW